MNRLFPRPRRLIPAGTLILMTAALAASGCGGGSTGRLSGRVTYKGEPVAGVLTLQSTASGPGASAYPIPITADGKFSTVGVPNGVYEVGVTPAPANFSSAPMGPRPPKDLSAAPVPQPGGAAVKHVDIPTKYLRPGTSGLTWEVKSGSQAKEFQLTD